MQLLLQNPSLPYSGTCECTSLITEAAPRMMQLSRVDPKSALHFNRTPSSIPNSPLGNSIRRKRISLKFLST
ncbi:3-deoxy-manno-octulosonate cytidylyltransferase [Gossypium arboreum]|uniref:3-deoxy-manno-octulosonate cytidylyltransferase n=1 Tax=Gossypium arboreum TaxID=29729 RepID=A0A0B0NYD3_GOSAR|nr:3-deoxy-manno-octulosonate cytidylyltransferase [Gossypium arboreum]